MGATYAKFKYEGPAFLSSRSRSASSVAQLEIEVARVDEHAKTLAQDEHRVADVERIAEQQHSAADREEPEGDRHDHLAGALGGDPLHEKAHREHDLCDIAEQHPPLEFGDEDLVQIGADRVRKFNEHRVLPPKPAARAACGGSATTLRQDRGCRSTADPTCRNWR